MKLNFVFINILTKKIIYIFIFLALVACSEFSTFKVDNGQTDGANPAMGTGVFTGSNIDEFYQQQAKDFKCDASGCPESAAKFIRVTENSGGQISYSTCSAVYIGDGRMVLNAHCFESESSVCSGRFYFPILEPKIGLENEPNKEPEIISCEPNFIAYERDDLNGIDYAVVQLSKKPNRKKAKIYNGVIKNKQKISFFGNSLDDNIIEKLDCRFNFTSIVAAELNNANNSKLMHDQCATKDGHSGGGLFIKNNDEWELAAIHHSSHKGLYILNPNGTVKQTINLAKKYDTDFGFSTNIRCLKLNGIYDENNCVPINKQKAYENQFIKLFNQSVYINNESLKAYLDLNIDNLYFRTGIKFEYELESNLNLNSIIDESLLNVSLLKAVCFDEGFDYTTSLNFKEEFEGFEISLDSNKYELTGEIREIHHKSIVLSEFNILPISSGSTEQAKLEFVEQVTETDTGKSSSNKITIESCGN